MKFRELTFVPENKDKPIKVVYEDDAKVTQTSDFTIKFVKKLRGMELEKFLEDMFGTTKIGIFDCSGMTDEEVDKIVEKFNSIPEEYTVPIK